MSEDEDEGKKSSSTTKDVIDAATGLVKAVPIYEDAVQPAAKQVGKSLETVGKAINVALAPIGALIWGFDQLHDFLTTIVAKKLADTPLDSICTPDPTVAGPALEALKYAGHKEELLEMYANLLATSLDSERSRSAHPSFVAIIEQLTPKEAKVLELLASRDQYPSVCAHTYREHCKSPKDTNFQEDFAVGYEFSQLFELRVVSDIDAYACLDNLLRLRLLDATLTNSTPDLDEDMQMASIGMKIDNITFDHKIEIAFTDFGKLFVSTCVPHHNENHEEIEPVVTEVEELPGFMKRTRSSLPPRH